MSTPGGFTWPGSSIRPLGITTIIGLTNTVLDQVLQDDARPADAAPLAVTLADPAQQVEHGKLPPAAPALAPLRTRAA